MEFQGRIYKVLEKRSGVSQRTGNEWTSQEFIFEYFEHDTDKFADRAVVETTNPEFINMVKEGANVRVGFYHNINEYQGRYYNRLRVYKMEMLDKSQNDTTQDALVGDNGGDDQPF